MENDLEILSIVKTVQINLPPATCGAEGEKVFFGEWIAFAPANINAVCASKGPILAS